MPFVWEEDGNIRLSVSGGAFHSVNPEELKFLKWTEGVFKDWGHCGACANGSVSFLAKVPLWFYAEPNPRYGDFTTETYRKFYLHKREESENGNLYQGFDIAFRDEAEFRQFLKDYEGTVFKGNWDNQIVLGVSVGNMCSYLPPNGKRLMPRSKRGGSTSIPSRSR